MTTSFARYQEQEREIEIIKLEEEKKENQRLNLLADKTFEGKISYGILSWTYSYYQTFHKIEHVCDNLKEIGDHLHQKLVNTYERGKRPFSYPNVMVYKVVDVNPRLVSPNILTTSGYEYMKMHFDRKSFWISRGHNGHLKKELKEELPEIDDLHHTSIKLLELKKKYTRWGLRKYVRENNLPIFNSKSLSYRKLKHEIRKYFLTNALREDDEF